MDSKLSRRSFLGLTAAGATVGAAAGIAGCATKSGGATRPAAADAAQVSTRPAGAAPTSADWKSLRHQLTGSLYRPSDKGYLQAHELYDPRFDHIKPQAVASVASAADVAHCVQFATAHSLPISLRAGGHSYIGASVGTGLVIDVRPLDTIHVGSGTATIGAGNHLVDVYGTLADHNVSVPGGSCPTVGLTGLLLGGGVGVVARKYGLSCDRLESAQVVTATGDIVTASASHNSDLFWALRGGGGSFGVVTSLTMKTHPTRELGVFTLEWDWSHAAAVFNAWQHWASEQPNALWSTCHLLADDDPSTPPSVSVSGVYYGTAAALTPHVDNLASRSHATPSYRYIADRGYLDTMLLEAGCDHDTVTACHLTSTPGGTLSRSSFVGASDLFSQPIPAAGVSAIVAAVETKQQHPMGGGGGVGFDSLGGAVGAVEADATAWVHRSSLFGAQWTASWSPSDPSRQAESVKSLAKLQASGHPYGNGSYQNYPNKALKHPQQAYYGSNLPRLESIKKKWDAKDVFKQPQGIRPAG